MVLQWPVALVLTAVILSGGAIGSAFILGSQATNRYSMTYVTGFASLARLDTLTGELALCTDTSRSSSQPACTVAKELGRR